MLPLPAFLDRANAVRADAQALRDALRLTGYFLNRHVYEPRAIGKPEARAGLINALQRQIEREGSAA